MKRRVLGLDIQEELVSAVVVEQRSGKKSIVACEYETLDSLTSLRTALTALLEKIRWHESSCVCGLQLGHGSLRNIVLPFKDKRKIEQTIFFELEELLLTPVDQQVIEYRIAGQSEQATRLLVAGLERSFLTSFLEDFDQCGLRPDIVTLRSIAVADQYMANSESTAKFLLLDAELHSLTLTCCHGGNVLLTRRLPYIDTMHTGMPFVLRERHVVVEHPEVASEIIGEVCENIERSLNYYRTESGFDFDPDTVIVTGTLSQSDFFVDRIKQMFSQKTIVGDLREMAGLQTAIAHDKQWHASTYDHALALALDGLKRKASMNFLKEEFAPRASFFASRVRIAAVATLVAGLIGAYTFSLYSDYRSLNDEYERLGAKMEAIFRETFPDVTRIQDPLNQMRSKVQETGNKATSLPIFSDDKRTLNILADISSLIPESVTIQVTRLVIDSDSVRVTGVTPTFNNVNSIQSALRKSSYYNGVEIVSATADKNDKQIRFEIRLQLTGGKA